MRHSSLVFQRVLSQLKWRSEGKHSLNCSWRRNLHIVARDFHDVAAGWQVSKTFRHARKSVVDVEKATRSWINKRDAAGHIRQHLLVKDHFAFQPLCGFYLALIKPVAQPREYCGQSDQPRRQHSHSSQKIVHRFVRQPLWLFHDRYPPSRLDRTGRIEVSMLFEVSEDFPVGRADCSNNISDWPFIG